MYLEIILDSWMAVTAASFSLPPLTDLTVILVCCRTYLHETEFLEPRFCIQWFSVWRHLQCGNIFSCHNSVGQGVEGGGATDIQKVEAKGAAKHITVYKTTPRTKNYPTLCVSRAEVEKT